jgi:hypothetical protein
LDIEQVIRPNTADFLPDALSQTIIVQRDSKCLKL